MCEKIDDIILFHGDCLEVMDKLIDQGRKVDAVITDIPYGTSGCKWDSVIPFPEMWSRIKLLRKDTTPIVLFGSEPFSSHLRLSNIKEFKYDWIWKKIGSNCGFAQAPYRALKEHEIISIFYHGGTAKNAKLKMTYNPQGLVDCNKVIKGRTESSHRKGRAKQNDYVQTKTNYPKSILVFKEDKHWLHPTQKPVELMKYLVSTYTNEGDVVLDFTCGSGTTLVACKELNRKGVGIEKEKEYYDITVNRIKFLRKEK